MIILSKKSWHFYLHKFMYGKDAKEPTNLCTYFWKSIIFGIVALLLLFPLAIPVIAVDYILRKFKIPITHSLLESGLLSKYFNRVILIDVILFVLYSMTAMWFIPLSSKTIGIYTVGYLGLVVSIIILVMYITSNIERTNFNSATKKYNIISTVIKSWYERNCPLIKWKK